MINVHPLSLSLHFWPCCKRNSGGDTYSIFLQNAETVGLITPDRGTWLVACDSWKVRNLIDWWPDVCYWTKDITELLAKDKIQIEPLGPPTTKGECSIVCHKDLPSLDWSVETGWTVIYLQTTGKFWCSAYLIPQNLGTTYLILYDSRPSGVVAEKTGSGYCQSSVLIWCCSKMTQDVLFCTGQLQIRNGLWSQPLLDTLWTSFFLCDGDIVCYAGALQLLSWRHVSSNSQGYIW